MKVSIFSLIPKGIDPVLVRDFENLTLIDSLTKISFVGGMYQVYLRKIFIISQLYLGVYMYTWHTKAY